MFKIIIAEDHTMHAEALAISMRQAIICQSILIVEDGLALVEKCEENKPDLIVLDIGLPKLNGFKATQEIRKTNTEVKILACSMYKDRNTIVEIFEVGANGFFHKTSDLAKFVIATLDVMNGKKYIDPAIQDVILGLEIPNTDNPIFERLVKKKAEGEIFTMRELRILRLLAEGMSTKGISELLKITEDAVNYHRSNMLQKTQCKNVANLIHWATVNHII